MPQGIAISVGLNGVDAPHYEGWDGHLVGCEFDADDMAAIAESAGFETHKLLTREATADALLSQLERAAGALDSGDILLLTCSCHGGHVPDANGDEDDRLDETWVLYDRQLVDNELYERWAMFKPGVRIAVFSDSSSPPSGTAVRNVLAAVAENKVAEAAGAARMKGMPFDVARAVYDSHRDLYDEIQRALPPFDKAEIGASVILISGCQDNQTSADGDRNGLFTQTLRQVWDDGRFHGGYRTFLKRIGQQMPPWQSPNLFVVGAENRGFLRQRPFTV